MWQCGPGVGGAGHLTRPRVMFDAQHGRRVAHPGVRKPTIQPPIATHLARPATDEGCPQATQTPTSSPPGPPRAAAGPRPVAASRAPPGSAAWPSAARALGRPAPRHPRHRRGAARRRRGDRIVATVDALVDQLAVMRGAAMKAGPGALDDRVPGPRRRTSPPTCRRGWPRCATTCPRSAGDRCARCSSSRVGPGARAGAGATSTPSPPPRRASARSTARRTRTAATLAIKVQYPGIAESVESDMRNLRLLTPLLRQLMPGLEVGDVLAELRERIVEECDYELEAANHRRVARFWRGHPVRPRSRASTPSSATGACSSPTGSTGWASTRSRAEPDPRPRPLRRDRLPLLLRHRARARPRARRPAPGQLPALPRRPRGASSTSA